MGTQTGKYPFNLLKVFNYQKLGDIQFFMGQKGRDFAFVNSFFFFVTAV